MKPDHPLERLRAQLSAPAEGYLDPQFYARLSIVEFEGRLHVDFFGSPFEEGYAELCRILASSEIAGTLASIALRCPDEGANGTCNWDLTSLAESESVFTALRFLTIQQSAPADHNRMIVAAVYDEGGVLGRVLRKAPVLDALVTPSAPDRSFFAMPVHPLRYLNVDAGYDTQGFIAHLADSHCFPSLQSLEFGEYNETYLDTFPEGCTPFSDYERLFRSEAFSTVRAFTWRNPVASSDEIASLRALRSHRDLHFKVVRFAATYVADTGIA